MTRSLTSIKHALEQARVVNAMHGKGIVAAAITIKWRRCWWSLWRKSFQRLSKTSPVMTPKNRITPDLMTVRIMYIMLNHV